MSNQGALPHHRPEDAWWQAVYTGPSTTVPDVSDVPDVPDVPDTEGAPDPAAETVTVDEWFDSALGMIGAQRRPADAVEPVDSVDSVDPVDSAPEPTVDEWFDSVLGMIGAQRGPEIASIEPVTGAAADAVTEDAIADAVEPAAGTRKSEEASTPPSGGRIGRVAAAPVAGPPSAERVGPESSEDSGGQTGNGSAAPDTPATPLVEPPARAADGGPARPVASAGAAAPAGRSAVPVVSAVPGGPAALGGPASPSGAPASSAEPTASPAPPAAPGVSPASSAGPAAPETLSVAPVAPAAPQAEWPARVADSGPARPVASAAPAAPAALGGSASPLGAPAPSASPGTPSAPSTAPAVPAVQPAASSAGVGDGRPVRSAVPAGGRARPAGGEVARVAEVGPDGLGEVVSDTVVDGARYGRSTLRAVSVRGEAARELGEGRRDGLLVTRFGDETDGGLLLAVVASPGAAQVAVGEACRQLAAAIGRSRAELSADLREGARDRLRYGLQRLALQAASPLRTEAEPGGSLHCLLIPLDPKATHRAAFGVGPGGLYLLRSGHWIDAYAARLLHHPDGEPPVTAPHGIGPLPRSFRFRLVPATTGDILLLCTPGLAEPIAEEAAVAHFLANHWAHPHPPGTVDFLRQLQVPAQGYAEDRTAAALWTE